MSVVLSVLFAAFLSALSGQPIAPRADGARTETLRSRHGFSFEYPADWESELEATLAMLPASVRWPGDVLQDAEVELAAHVHAPRLLPGVEVHVVHRPLDVQGSAEGLLGQVRELLLRTHEDAGDLQGRVRSVAGRPALELRYTALGLRSLLCYVAGRHRTYVVECTSSVEDYALHEADFLRVIESMQVDRSVWLRTPLAGLRLPMAAWYAIFGAAAGLGIGLIRPILRFFKRDLSASLR